MIDSVNHRDSKNPSPPLLSFRYFKVINFLVHQYAIDFFNGSDSNNSLD
jgi:hypothetical protein